MKSCNHRAPDPFRLGRDCRVRLDERHPADTGGPRSDRAAQPDWVYDFVAAPSDVPADSSIGSGLSAPSTPLTTGQIQTGRQFGALVARSGCRYSRHGTFGCEGWARIVAAGRRRRNPRVPSLRPRRQCSKAFRQRIRLGNFGDGYGGGRIPDDARKACANWGRGRSVPPETKPQELLRRPRSPSPPAIRSD